MPALKQNLTIEQGADWSHGWAVTVLNDPIDETWTARAQIRNEAGELLYEFDASVNEIGAVIIAVDPDESSSWTWYDAKYDVKVTKADGSLKLRVAEGNVTLDKQVTL